MRALVTGGTGFIGSHLVEALLKKGLSVRCLARDPAKRGWLSGLQEAQGLEFIRGDCSDPESLKGAAAGVDYVFHAAGVTKAARPQGYYEGNGEGTKNIAMAAARDSGGLRKFVYVSSQAAMGPSREGRPRREDDPPEPVSDYGRSKLLGEKYVLGLKSGLDAVIVRPTSVYGPRDRDIYTFFKLVSRGIRTTFRDERLVSLCYVDDLVAGIISAAFGDTESGEAFFVADPAPYSWDEIGETIAGALGVRARRLVLPLPALSVAAVIAEALAALAGRPALLNRQKMAELRQRYWVVDTGRAKERLGFEASYDFKAGARITADWYRVNGWL